MSPQSLLSYYPTYSILDEVLAQNGFKELNIFMDLKNNLQTTYMEHAIVNILEMSKRSRYMDTSIFLSLLSFLSFHILYSISRNIKINFYIFFESGISYYHKNISKAYKISRRLDDLYGLDRGDRDKFYEILNANYTLIEKVGNLLPNVKVLRLQNLEADFLPYYLTTRNIIPQDHIANVIYSNDHDLLQCANNNTFIFQKHAKFKRLVKSGEIMKRELKRETKILDEFQPLAMAIVGDTGDDVTGVDKVGPVRFIEIFDELVSLTGNMEDIYTKVDNNQPLFNTNHCISGNKYLNKTISEELKNGLISKNLKLVSFELISREFENPSTTEMLDKKNGLNKVLRNSEIRELIALKDSLAKVGCVILGEELDILFYNHNKR